MLLLGETQRHPAHQYPGGTCLGQLQLPAQAAERRLAAPGDGRHSQLRLMLFSVSLPVSVFWFCFEEPGEVRHLAEGLLAEGLWTLNSPHIYKHIVWFSFSRPSLDTRREKHAKPSLSLTSPEADWLKVSWRIGEMVQRRSRRPQRFLTTTSVTSRSVGLQFGWLLFKFYLLLSKRYASGMRHKCVLYYKKYYA